jgi:hypothetical protein
MKTKYRILLILPLLFLPAVLGAADFSLITNQYSEASNLETGESKFVEYRLDFLPAISFLIGDTGDFTLSAKISLDWQDEFIWTPELQRTEFSYRWGNVGFRAGRMNYSDPLGFIVSGLFDGVQFEHNSKAGTFSLGVWYTGFLYKKISYIVMKQEEQTAFAVPVDLSDMDTYFASRRLLASLDWENLSIADFLQLSAAITAQFDLSDADEEKYNSQYVTLKATIPVKSFSFEMGGSLEIAEVDEKDPDIALAGDLGIYWKLPSTFNSRLSLTGRFNSGHTKGKIKEFIPFTNRLYGDILKVKLPGITILGMNYSALFVPSFGISLNASHFMRNDFVTCKVYPIDVDNDNYGTSLGTEFFAQLVWSPLSDFQVSLGGGAFFPSLGNVAPDDSPQWRAELSVIIALF